MKVSSTDFRVQEGQKVDLDKWPTSVEPVYESKKQYQKILSDHVAQLSSLQQLLYASNRYAVLLIFQAMDAAGKDGVIKHDTSTITGPASSSFTSTCRRRSSETVFCNASTSRKRTGNSAFPMSRSGDFGNSTCWRMRNA